MVLTNSKSTEGELSVIPRITSIQLEANQKLVSFLVMRQPSLNSEMIALLEPLESDILESQILGLFGFLQQEKNRVAFFTILCKSLTKEQRRQYMKDSISTLRQALKSIRKLKLLSSARNR